MSRERVPLKCGDLDARAVVPVEDEIGGVVIYAGGRPAYYVLQGEWFEALPEPRAVSRVAGAGRGLGDVDPASDLRVS